MRQYIPNILTMQLQKVHIDLATSDYHDLDFLEVPETWLTTVITCLHKKDLKIIPKNYRTICIQD